MAEGFRTPLLNAALRTIEGLAVSCVAVLATRYGLFLWTEKPDAVWVIVKMGGVLLALFIAGFWWRRTERTVTDAPSEPYGEMHDKALNFLYLVLLAHAVIVIVTAIPVLILYLTVDPANYPKAIRVSVCLMSTGIGILYYLKNRERIQGPATVLGYFSAVCLGPAGLVMVFL